MSSRALWYEELIGASVASLMFVVCAAAPEAINDTKAIDSTVRRNMGPPELVCESFVNAVEQQARPLLRHQRDQPARRVLFRIHREGCLEQPLEFCPVLRGHGNAGRQGYVWTRG